MNEEQIKEKLKKKTRSVNDLNISEYRTYINSYIHNKINILRNFFSNLEVNLLSRRSFFSSFYKLREFERNGVHFVATRLKYSLEDIFIPYDLNQIMEIYLKTDSSEEGIFKKSASIDIIKKAIKEFEECISNKNGAEKMLKYDALAFGSVFRNFFSYYKQHINYFMKLKSYEDESEKLVILQFLFINMPKKNRHTLEAVIVFIELVHHLASENDPLHKKV